MSIELICIAPFRPAVQHAAQYALVFWPPPAGQGARWQKKPGRRGELVPKSQPEKSHQVGLVLYPDWGTVSQV